MEQLARAEKDLVPLQKFSLEVREFGNTTPFFNLFGSSLTYLCLNYSKLTDELASTIANNCPNIENLTLFDLPITEVALTEFALKCPKIEELNLKLLGKLKSIDALLLMNSLKTLTLYQVNSVTDESWMKLSEHKSLNKIEINGSSWKYPALSQLRSNLRHLSSE